MKRENIYKRILYGCLLCLLVLGMTACGGKEHQDTEIQQSESDVDAAQELYMIMSNDTMEESLCLRSLDTGLEAYYKYGMPTDFRDKYGSITSGIAFTPGRIVTIGDIDSDGYLTEVMLSKEVWEYEKVRRFSIDEEKGILTIVDTKYSIREEVQLFSNGKQIAFSGISEEDVLTVVGMDKRILSINVTTGHGTLALTNTDLFENSFLQLNQNIFTMITENMILELPEGSYSLKVANDGWGGTTEIQIVRDETTELDLDTLKGEGKKKGLISFSIDVDDVEVYVDYKLIDHTQAVELTYGTHVLQIKADGYDTWKKYLTVNSEEATIVIELTEDSSVEKEDSKTEDTETEDSETEETETESTEEAASTEEVSTQQETESTEE